MQVGLRPVLLALLSKSPNTGYGLGRLLRQQLSHVWAARLQQIYAELAKLHADGLVDLELTALANRPAKKVYSLTAPGEEALDRWLRQVSAVCPRKDDLLVRLYRLDRLPPDLVARRLSERRDECVDQAAALRLQVERTPRTDPAQLGLLLTLEAVIARDESEASWCERTIDLLRGEEEIAGVERPAPRRTVTGASRRA